jgi:hypothetical protein
LDTPRTNLKDPPAPTPCNINQELEQDPTQELEEIVTNTERIMDQATAAFQEEDNNANQTCLVIEGLSTIAPTAATNNQMLLMIQFMDKLGDKYHWVLRNTRKTKDTIRKNSRKRSPKLDQALWTSSEINMEHIITTQSSNAEHKMQQQLHKLVWPHINSTMTEIIKQLNDKLDGYKHNLDSLYFEKKSELISDLDHFQDRASLVLDTAMEDFYTRTVYHTRYHQDSLSTWTYTSRHKSPQW